MSAPAGLRRDDRTTALAGLVSGDELVIVSLGSSVDEWYNAAPRLRSASPFQQQVGCVTPEALGLAIGLPGRRVISLDADGGLPFNLGILSILATLGNEQPPNPLVVAWDNECHQSVGWPPAHPVSGRVDLAAIARGAGVAGAHTARTLTEFAGLCKEGLAADRPFVIVAKVDPSVPQDIRREQSDGREDKYIFVRHVEETEGIVIMGPSEHN